MQETKDPAVNKLNVWIHLVVNNSKNSQMKAIWTEVKYVVRSQSTFRKREVETAEDEFRELFNDPLKQSFLSLSTMLLWASTSQLSTSKTAYPHSQQLRAVSLAAFKSFISLLIIFLWPDSCWQSSRNINCCTN